MTAAEQHKAEVARLVKRLFGAWARTPDVDMYAGYQTALRGLTLDHIRHGIAEAIDLRDKHVPPGWRVAELAREWRPPPLPMSRQLGKAGPPKPWTEEEKAEAARLKRAPVCGQCHHADLHGHECKGPVNKT